MRACASVHNARLRLLWLVGPLPFGLLGLFPRWIFVLRLGFFGFLFRLLLLLANPRQLRYRHATQKTYC